MFATLRCGSNKNGESIHLEHRHKPDNVRVPGLQHSACQNCRTSKVRFRFQFRQCTVTDFDIISLGVLEIELAVQDALKRAWIAAIHFHQHPKDASTM